MDRESLGFRGPGLSEQDQFPHPARADESVSRRAYPRPCSQ